MIIENWSPMRNLVWISFPLSAHSTLPVRGFYAIAYFMYLIPSLKNCCKVDDFLKSKQTIYSFNKHWLCLCLWHFSFRCLGTPELFPNCTIQFNIIEKPFLKLLWLHACSISGNKVAFTPEMLFLETEIILNKNINVIYSTPRVFNHNYI